MKTINNNEIEQALIKTSRIYLSGKLTGENLIREISDTNTEIGISSYNSFSVDKPHYHEFNREFNYILDGELKVFLIDEKREYHLKKGDLYVFDVGEKYIVKTKKTQKFFS